MKKTVNIVGIDYQHTDLDSALAADLATILAHSKCQQLVFANAYSICMFHSNPAFRSAVQQTDKVYADGFSVSLASSILGIAKLPRIAGPDYMQAMLAICKQESLPCFFLGCANENDLAKLHQIIVGKYGETTWGGGYCPPFGEWDESHTQAIVDRINKSSSRILWVGVGSPKQDLFISRIRPYISVSIAAGVGAAFDFTTGKINRAPFWMRRIGFEWLHRLATNPRRLWKRYLLGNFHFFMLVFKNYVKSKRRV